MPEVSAEATMSAVSAKSPRPEPRMTAILGLSRVSPRRCLAEALTARRTASAPWSLLFLFIRHSVCGRRGRTPDETRQDDHGENIRNHLNKLGRYAPALELDHQRLGKPEEEGSRQCSCRLPLSDDHRRQGDIPPPGRHPV